MVKKLNVGIIGLGVGLNHLKCFIQKEDIATQDLMQE